MRLTFLTLALALTIPSSCLAQNWEVGGLGGYGWYHNPSISDSVTSVRAGFPSHAAVGAVFTDNMYQYVGGELFYLARFGGPQIESNGIKESVNGYTNAITYDLLFHMRPRESKIRPFVSAGAGIKVFTGSSLNLYQPLDGLAVLTRRTQVEPAVNLGAGLKYLLPKHIQLRLAFQVLMSPLPDEVIRPVGFANIHGWVYDFVPLAGIGYVF
jgi:hypothetical protein